MTATLAEPVPIRFKLTLQRRLREADRSEKLRDLARDTEIGDHDQPWVPDDRTECALRTWLHHSLLEAGDAVAWAAFSEYHNSLLIADGLESGAIDWSEYAPYTCADRQEHAWWDAVGEVDGHMRVLLGGYGAARHIHTTQMGA